MSKQTSKEDIGLFNKQYADIARSYLKSKKVYKYHLKKIEDMDDNEVIQKCHYWYEHNRLVAEYKKFEDKMLSGR